MSSSFKCLLARRFISSAVTASMRAEISSGVNSSAPIIRLRPLRVMRVAVPSMAGLRRRDACGDLLRRQQFGTHNKASADTGHARGSALHGENSGALELLFSPAELLITDGLRPDFVKLPSDNLHGFFDVAGSGANVHLDGAGIRVALMIRVNGVSEPALFTHLLKETTAHSAAEHVVESAHREAILTAGGQTSGTHRHMVL